MYLAFGVGTITKCASNAIFGFEEQNLDRFDMESVISFEKVFQSNKTSRASSNDGDTHFQIRSSERNEHTHTGTGGEDRNETQCCVTSTLQAGAQSSRIP